jgi:5'/3'-nucleotidase
MLTDKLILLTNDDGINAFGLKVFENVLTDLGATVFVVAPDRERSAVSHAISLRSPLRMKEIQKRWFSLTGTPADCTYMGLMEVLPGKPDFIFSGINNGYNLGNDVLYSGTVAGAMEATLRGLNAMSVSTARNCQLEVLKSTAHFAALISLEIMKSKNLPDFTLYNMNHPHVQKPHGVKITSLGKRNYLDEVTKKLDPKGIPYYWIGGPGTPGFTNLEGGERDSLDNDFVSLSPISTTLSSPITKELKELEFNS